MPSARAPTGTIRRSSSSWDDWGGWYDHVEPAVYNSYELGFRVPLIAIGAYAKAGYISTKHHEFGSILKFTEEVFGLPIAGNDRCPLR